MRFYKLAVLRDGRFIGFQCDLQIRTFIALYIEPYRFCSRAWLLNQSFSTSEFLFIGVTVRSFLIISSSNETTSVALLLIPLILLIRVSLKNVLKNDHLGTYLKINFVPVLSFFANLLYNISSSNPEIIHVSIPSFTTFVNSSNFFSISPVTLVLPDEAFAEIF